jgi:hypothetical protein
MKPVERSRLAEMLGALVRGLVVDRVEYGITEWRLRFATEGGCSFWCADLRCSESALWRPVLATAPFNVAPANEPEAPAVALVVFEIVNNFAVREIVIGGEDCDLGIVFENGRQLVAAGRPDMVDLSWGFDRDDTSLACCSFGELFADPALLARSGE